MVIPYRPIPPPAPPATLANHSFLTIAQPTTATAAEVYQGITWEEEVLTPAALTFGDMCATLVREDTELVERKADPFTATKSSKCWYGIDQATRFARLEARLRASLSRAIDDAMTGDQIIQSFGQADVTVVTATPQTLECALSLAEELDISSLTNATYWLPPGEGIRLPEKVAATGQRYVSPYGSNIILTYGLQDMTTTWGGDHTRWLMVTGPIYLIQGPVKKTVEQDLRQNQLDLNVSRPLIPYYANDVYAIALQDPCEVTE
jgi:hypothetical protein